MRRRREGGRRMLISSRKGQRVGLGWIGTGELVLGSEEMR